MKKRTLLLCLLFAALFVAKADPVDQHRAKEIGAKFLTTSVGMRASTADLTLAKTYRMDNGDAAFYVFSTATGFVIVSAQDVATPILGYSDEGPFDADDIPENMEWWLQDYANQIQYGMETKDMDLGKTAKQWELVKATGRLSENRNRSVVVSPLLGDITWNQDRYYNSLCPEAYAPTLGNHTYAGCVACAMSQIMRKWNHPAHGYGSHQLPPYNNPDNVLDFSQTTYAWANMPVALTDVNGDLLDGITEDQITAVATLIYHAGVSVFTTYSTSGSAADVSNPVGAFKNNFDYSDELEIEGLSFQDGGVAMWKAKLRSSLDHGYPVFYGGSSSSGAAHAFVCDGYDSDDHFHINWGYSGNQNSYYAIGALNYGATGYNAQNYAIFNIHPNGTTTSHDVTLSQNNEHGTVSGSGTFTHGTSVTVHAEATTNGYYFCYWTEDGVVVSENADYTFNIKYNRNLQAVFLDAFTITAETSNESQGTVAVSGNGTFAYNENCTLTATANTGYIFENWTKNNEIVSCDNPYTFAVTGPGTYMAHFISLEGQYIGDNNNDHSNAIPSNALYKYSITEQIYTAAELGEAGDVNSIALYNLGYVGYVSNLDDVTRNLDIYMKATDKTEFVGTSDWITGIGPEDWVFSGTVTFEYGTWTTINLDNTFAYNGTSNLALIIVDRTGSTGTRHEFKTFATSNYSSLYIAQDTEFDPNNMSGVTGLRTKQKNKIIVNKSEHTGIYTVSASVNPSESGFVTDGSDNSFVSALFNDGAECTLKANPNSSYVFRYWTKNGKIMSHDATYTFTVKSNVSLVAVFAAPSTVSVSINPANSGTVTGAGDYTYGSTCTLTAMPAEGYAFNKWTIGGETVSFNDEYSFTVTEDVTVVANFREANRIVFDDDAVKAKCVSNWDTNGDREISIQEAAAVTDLSSTFRYDIQITSFNELRFFTGLTTIGWYFASCSKLTSVCIPETVTSISSSAFSSCSKLMSITIPRNVTTIGYNAFRGCTGLTCIVSECVTPPTLGNNCFENVSTTIPVYVPKGSVAAYKAASGWSSFSKIVSVKTSDWSAPTATDAVYVDANYALTDDVTVADVYFASEAYVLTIPEGKTLTVTGSIDATLPSQIVVEDGGQLICNNPVHATVKKSVAHGGGAKDAANWYTIASPINTPTFDKVNNLIQATAENYDLYRYNEATSMWENQRNTADHADFTTLENGRGYLYWNNTGAELSFAGQLNSSDVIFSLTYGATNALKGFNLIGNPFPHNIYKGTGGAINDSRLTSGFYVLNDASGWSAKLDYTTPIVPGQGILVKTTEAFDLTITNTNAASSTDTRSNSNDLIAFNVANDKYEDVAYVQFKEAINLNKIEHLNAEIPLLYIHQDNVDYAIANMNRDVASFDLNFVAATAGTYTVSAKAEGEFEYFHLIDRITGKDIDMLNEGKYTFTANPNDYEYRFVVKLSEEGNDDTTVEMGNDFAFISNGEIIINVEGTVQLLDMTGRVIISKDDVHSISTVGLKPSVYVLRLIDANGTRVQKIVVE